jgi:hypothetical protein
MRKVIAVAFLLFAVVSLAAAQIPTSGNVFLGYSYLNTTVAGANRANTNGWEASFEGKIVPFLGMVADFDAHYSGTVNFPVSDCSIGCPAQPAGGTPGAGGYLSASVSEHNFLFGPRVSVSAGRFRPFAELLVGASHISANSASAPSFGSATSFATAVGGGIDYRLIRLVAWRLQGDYVHVSFFGTRQNNVRISTGIVLRF